MMHTVCILISGAIQSLQNFTIIIECIAEILHAVCSILHALFGPCFLYSSGHLEKKIEE